MGMTLLQLPNSVVNIADIRSAFIETLVSEHVRKNAVDDALLSLVPPLPPVSTVQSTHTKAPITLSVCPPLSEATSCE